METEEHLLSLKVLRLGRPLIASHLPVTCDSKDLPENLLNTALQQDITAAKGTETLNIGQFLVIPQIPVNIHLGETFSGFISVYSETNQPIKNISVKIDLQTSAQIIPLSANPATPELAPDDIINLVVHHEMKEIGMNILMCEVHYQNSAGTVKQLRKYFKIQVLKPLDVKTKLYNAENEDVYLEAQVQNITAGPICLEKVSLDASHLFNVVCLNVSPPSGESVFGKHTILKPQAISQYLYCLSPNEKLTNDLKSLSGATNIGKLDIVWRSNMGESGRLQTSQLQRIGLNYGDLHLSIVELPNFVTLEDLFAFNCKIINNSERELELVLHLENSDGLTWCGISGRRINTIPSKSTQILEFKVIPLMPGLRTISGIKLYDTHTKKTHTYDELGQVFVIVNDVHKKGIRGA